MAKTIKDMAHEFGWTQDEDGRGYAAFCFDMGAKAVLAEIENAISAKRYHEANDEAGMCRCSYTEFVKDELIGKIKELLGQ